MIKNNTKSIMKKIILGLMIFVLCFSLYGCKDSNNNNADARNNFNNKMRNNFDGDLNGDNMNEFNNRDFNKQFNNDDFDIIEFKEKVASLPDDASFQDVMELLGISNIGTRQPFPNDRKNNDLVTENEINE